MEKERALEKLKELGIETQNFFNKKTYVRNNEVCIGIFPVEADREEVFYFSINSEEKLYGVDRVVVKDCDLEKHFGQDKYQVPLRHATLLWQNQPYVEMPDLPFTKMTVRMFYAMLQNKPVSNVDWLDTLIRQNQ